MHIHLHIHIHLHLHIHTRMHKYVCISSTNVCVCERIYIWVSANIWGVLWRGDHRVWSFSETGEVTRTVTIDRQCLSVLRSWGSSQLISEDLLTQMWQSAVSPGQKYKKLSLAWLCPAGSTSTSNKGRWANRKLLGKWDTLLLIFMERQDGPLQRHPRDKGLGACLGL